MDLISSPWAGWPAHPVLIFSVSLDRRIKSADGEARHSLAEKILGGNIRRRLGEVDVKDGVFIFNGKADTRVIKTPTVKTVH